MELKKTSECIRRAYQNGEQNDYVESAEYQINGSDGSVLGCCTIQAHGNIQMRMNEIYGFNGIEDGEAKLRVIFGIDE